MDRNRIRAIVQGQFQSSLAQSGVQITAMPPEELNALTAAVADGLFAVLDAMEDHDGYAANPTAAAAGLQETSADYSERLLWSGRPYLSIGVRYELTTERLRVSRGLLGTSIEEIELVRVRDTKVKQHMGERAVNVGDITVVSTDPSTPELTLHNVKDPMDVRELIRKAVIAEKDRRGLNYREEM